MRIRAGLIRQHQNATVEVQISIGQVFLVVRGKPVGNRYVSSALAQLEYANGKICARDETTFSRFSVNITVTIRRKASPSLPDAAPISARFAVEDTFLCPGRGVVRHDPTFIYNVATRSSPGNVNVSIGQQQPRAVHLVLVREKIVLAI